MAGAQLRVDPVVQRVASKPQESAKINMPSADALKSAALARVQQMKEQQAQAKTPETPSTPVTPAAPATPDPPAAPVTPAAPATPEPTATPNESESTTAPVSPETPVSPQLPVQTAPPVGPTAIPSEPVVPRPAGKLRRVDSISMDLSQPNKTVDSIKNDVTSEPLTQEQLDTLWKETLNAMKEPLPRLYEQLQDKEVALESDDKFVIHVSNSYTEQEIKNNIIRILTYMRKRSGHPKLNCRVEITVVEREAKPYTARDKYDALLAQNPVLEMMRVIFPDVEM